MKTGRAWGQRVSAPDSIGPGNCSKDDPDTFECCGIRIPTDGPVEWGTIVEPTAHSVSFTIRLTNLGPAPLRKAGAAICLKFLDAEWWTDETTFALCERYRRQAR